MSYALLGTEIRELIDVLKVAERDALNASVSTQSYVKWNSLVAFAQRIRKQIYVMENLLSEDQKRKESFTANSGSKDYENAEISETSRDHFVLSSQVNLKEIRSTLKCYC